jgi:predicted DNA-binding ribbon-helix-helix protein
VCEFFVKADPIAYEQRSRTVRMHGVLTSIRLENMVWDTLAEMAEEEGCTTNALIATFHAEIHAHRGEVPNFASFLRVCSMRYLRRKVTQAERQADSREREHAQTLPTGSAAPKGGAPKVVPMTAHG